MILCWLGVYVFFVSFGRVAAAEVALYNSLMMRKNVAVACSTSDFSKVVMTIDDECPEFLKRQLRECSSGCDLAIRKKNKKENDEYELKNTFREEIGETIKMTANGTHKTKVEVDLRTVLERYTKYNGSIVWDAIHKLGRNDPLLNVLLSGVHCSVSVHLCSFYNEDPENRKLYMNYALMQQKVTPAYFNNLRYTLDFLISLLPVAISDLSSIAQTKDGIQAIDSLKNSLLKNRTYDYSEYKSDENTVRRCEEVFKYMGCVDCMRCKVWGKVQFEGLKCAIKLLRKAQGNPIALDRFELVTFLNLLNRVSTSVAQYNKYRMDVDKFNRSMKETQERKSNVLDATYAAIASPLAMNKNVQRRRA
ncbi:ERO1-like protein alpha [Nematocida minor]|uniref:ERO1-like protein alpha n=1 Tax=Nematocida minor TaxID=1912983 RepID=UPI0022209105|nr:ERO1-like protein alpha [Nematocida minor]KAI5190397.1 ERO1-like protein alpha [Nematocida minor]